MRAIRHGWILAAIAMLIVGCGSGDNKDSGTSTGSTSTTGTTGSADNGGSMDIAVIPKGSTHEFWKSVHAGADEAGKELGVNIIFNGPEKEDDKESQIKMVETMVNKGVKGIVLAPLDDQALVRPVEDAIKQGIPVLIIDSGLGTDKYVSFVATDNEAGGKKDAEEMVRLLNGKGRIAVLRYQKGSASTDAREKGFIDEIMKHPDIKIVSQNIEAGATRETAMKGAENMLAAYRKADGSLDLDGVYAPNESSTFGMMKVLEQNNWAGKVKFVGFDAAPELLDGLRNGHIHALVVQNPRKMGYEGVKQLVASIKGQTVEKRIDTGATLVTKENMEQPEIAKLLESPK